MMINIKKYMRKGQASVWGLCLTHILDSNVQATEKYKCFWLQNPVMNHIVIFKSPWLSLHHPFVVILPVHI